MKRIVFVLLLVSCGGKPARPAAPASEAEPAVQTQPAPAAKEQTLSEQAMAMMQSFADRMCTCKDMACAEQVSDDMTRWAQQMAKEHPDPPKMSEEEVQRATALGERMGKCMKDVFGASAKPTTPHEGPRSAEEQRNAEQTMDAFDAFADRMCKCKDRRCAEQVADDMTRWSQDQAKLQRNPPKMTEADTKRASAIGERMGKCMQSAMSTTAP